MFGVASAWSEYSKPLAMGNLNYVPALLEKISAGSRRATRYRGIAAALKSQLAQFCLNHLEPITASNSCAFNWHSSIPYHPHRFCGLGVMRTKMRQKARKMTLSISLSISFTPNQQKSKSPIQTKDFRGNFSLQK
jgi:hypothetical protein